MLPVSAVVEVLVRYNNPFGESTAHIAAPMKPLAVFAYFVIHGVHLLPQNAYPQTTVTVRTSFARSKLPKSGSFRRAAFAWGVPISFRRI